VVLGIGARNTWDDAPSGGQMLRALRLAAKLSLIELAGKLNDHDFRTDAAHLQRIESGRIKQPTAETVEAILSAGLEAPYRTRRDVLEAFGYRLPWPLPTEQEIAESRRLYFYDLEGTTWPAYLVDFTQRIWAWNRYVPRVLGLAPDDPSLARFTGVSVLDLAFNPEFGINLQITDADSYLPRMLAMLRIQMLPHADDPWFSALIARAHGWPQFDAMWSRSPDDPDEVLTDQYLVPIKLRVPGIANPLRFRPTLIHLSGDPRFQIVHYIPFGAATLRQCAVWAEEEGEH